MKIQAEFDTNTDAIHPCMTRPQVDFLMGRKFFDKRFNGMHSIVKIVGREQVGFSSLIKEDIYVAVAEDHMGLRFLRDLSQLGEEVPERYGRFREIMIVMAQSEGEEWN